MRMNFSNSSLNRGERSLTLFPHADTEMSCFPRKLAAFSSPSAVVGSADASLTNRKNMRQSAKSLAKIDSNGRPRTASASNTPRALSATSGFMMTRAALPWYRARGGSARARGASKALTEAEIAPLGNGSSPPDLGKRNAFSRRKRSRAGRARVARITAHAARKLRLDSTHASSSNLTRTACPRNDPRPATSAWTPVAPETCDPRDRSRSRHRAS